MHSWMIGGLVAVGTLVITILVASLILSYRVTRRSYLWESGSPAELGLEFEKVSFKTSDGINLAGWYIPAGKSRRTVILLHGHHSSMDSNLKHLPAIHQAGFNVFMFDFRANGRSHGRICTVGYLERQDALAAIDFVLLKGAGRIVLVGFSMGGMVALLTAPISSHVHAVISDGAPLRLTSAFQGWAREHHIPAWIYRPMAYCLVLMMSLRQGVNLFKFEPVRWVGKIAPRPLMLIHGELDPYCYDFQDMAAAARGAEIWREPGIGHCQIPVQMPEEYKNRLVEFLKIHS